MNHFSILTWPAQKRCGLPFPYFLSGWHFLETHSQDPHRPEKDQMCTFHSLNNWGVASFTPREYGNTSQYWPLPWESGSKSLAAQGQAGSEGTQVLSCLVESLPSCPYSTFNPRERESESICDKSITLFYAPRDSKNNHEYRKANTLVSTLGVNILLEKKNPSSTGFALC